MMPKAKMVNIKVAFGRYDGLLGNVGGDGVRDVFSCGVLVFLFFILSWIK